MNSQEVATNRPSFSATRPAAGSSAAPAPTGAGLRVAGGPDRAAGEALRVIDLSKIYRSGFLRRRIRAIDGVSFTVPYGGVFALLGHNGAGKTTTINCVLDLVRPDRGEVEILGHDHRDRRSRSRLGYLPERPYFFDHLNGYELLRFYAQLLEIPARDQRRRIDEVLARTEMTAHASRRLKKYSKGMLQRIGLAQALIGDPELLILDEPMSGLDPLGRRQVRDLLVELKNQGKTIILSSHIVPDLEVLADRVAILAHGRVVANQSLTELQAQPAYRVTLSRPARADDDWQWPAWVDLGCGVQVQSDRPEGTVRHYAAPDVEDLRGLLEQCRREHIRVGRIEPAGSGLEDLFLAATEQAAAQTAKEAS